MNFSLNEMSAFKELISKNEDYLMKRLFHYAIGRKYAEGSAALEEAWRRCVAGLSGAIMEGVETLYPDFEFGPEHDFRKDPLCVFIVDTARRHRARGTSLQMFHGLMVYYKEAWLDLVRQAEFEEDYKNTCLQIITRMFDRFMIALCGEWAESDQSKQIEKLQTRNRAMVVEKNRYLTIFESVPNPVFILDEQNQIINFNVAASVMLNVSVTIHGAQYYDTDATTSDSDSPTHKDESADAVIGKPLIRFFPWLADALDHFIAGNDASVSIEQEVRDQKTRYFGIKFSRILDVSQTFGGVIIILEDITEKKEAVEELRKAKEAAEAASHAKSEFLSNMSHELRTPLNGVLGYAQILMRDKELNTFQKDGLEIIYKSGDHLLTLITDILDLAKVEAGKLELIPEDFHFQTFLDGIAGIIRMRAEQENVLFKYDALTPLPEGVRADETRLRQVLINLLGNSVKFTKKGTVTFDVSVLSTRQSEKNKTASGMSLIRFEVSDTGVGMTPEELELIFKPFEQVGNIQSKAAGTGLGLSISRQLIEMMGSEIKVTSEYGKGSTFWFDVELPVVSAIAKVSNVQTREITGYKGKPVRVLVADDEQRNRLLFVKLLEPLGFDIIGLAENGQELVDKAIEKEPDVILTDLIMPVMTGFEAVQQIRQIPGLQNTLIIAASASVFDKDIRNSKLAGCDEFISKPVNTDRLLEILGTNLKLEWIYDKSGTEEPPESAAEKSAESLPLIPPPAKEMKTLYELALGGDMDEISEYAVYLEKLDTQYIPFAQKLQGFARGFQDEQIMQFIRQYM